MPIPCPKDSCLKPKYTEGLIPEPKKQVEDSDKLPLAEKYLRFLSSSDQRFFVKLCSQFLTVDNPRVKIDDLPILESTCCIILLGLDCLELSQAKEGRLTDKDECKDRVNGAPSESKTVQDLS